MKISIIIVNYNGEIYLDNCLNTILKSKQTLYEIIIVDNNSTDKSKEILKKYTNRYKNIYTIYLQNNFGPAYARNIGVKQATGDIIAFLDNDTQVDPDWLNKPAKIFLDDPKIGCIQSKLLLLNHKNRFDYAGDYLNQFGLLSHRATYGDIDNGQCDQNVEILAAKSAAMFIRKTVFNAIKGFDTDYFIYMEETDLCWRSWLYGYKTIFCFDSIVYHGYSGSFKVLNISFANYNLRFHGTKNYILTLLKNLSFSKLITILPLQLIIFLCYSLYFLIQLKFKDFYLIHKAIIWNILNLASTLQKRSIIQKYRHISDSELFKYIYKQENLFNKINHSILLKSNF